MARPLSTSDPLRGGPNGNYQARYGLDDAAAGASPAEELEQLRSENTQLRALCTELEQALQEATQQTADTSGSEERIREYELLVDEKSETIRQLHQQLQEVQAAVEEAANRPAQGPARGGPLPREEELLSLSEELERERRQLQEDEQSLMEQMRQM